MTIMKVIVCYVLATKLRMNFIKSLDAFTFKTSVTNISRNSLEADEGVKNGTIFSDYTSKVVRRNISIFCCEIIKTKC